MDQIYRGFYFVPKSYKHANGFQAEMWNWNGSITTPCFEEEYVEHFYKVDQDFHIVMELPDDIKYLALVTLVVQCNPNVLSIYL